MTKAFLIGSLLVAVLLGGCHRAHKQQSVDALDRELTSTNVADPAVKSALEDQIMVDPQLAAKANEHSIRPADEPYDAPIPPNERATAMTGAAPTTLAQKASSAGRQAGCNMAVAYSAMWSNKLPAELPIYPQGHVSEAAGSDTATCHLRVVSYSSSAPAQSITDFYSSHGQQAGYSVSLNGDTLRGTRSRDGAMFVITASDTASGGSAVDVVSNAGI